MGWTGTLTATTTVAVKDFHRLVFSPHQSRVYLHTPTSLESVRWWEIGSSGSFIIFLQDEMKRFSTWSSPGLDLFFFSCSFLFAPSALLFSVQEGYQRRTRERVLEAFTTMVWKVWVMKFLVWWNRFKNREPSLTLDIWINKKAILIDGIEKNGAKKFRR